MTDRVDAINYFTEITGFLGVIGWILHRTVLRGKWFVTAEPVAATGPAAIRVNNLTKKQAAATFADLIAWLEAGGSIAAFNSARAPTQSGRPAPI